MQIDPIETDILGDMAQDDHSLYEIFEFVRGHHPDAFDTEVFATGRQILANWIQRGEPAGRKARPRVNGSRRARRPTSTLRGSHPV
jgi:hypothetical protein